MLHPLALSLLASTGSATAGSPESFFVYGPDAKDQQVQRVHITVHDGGAVKAEVLDPLGLSFAPTSIAATPKGQHLIVSATRAGKGAGKGAAAATLAPTANGTLQLVATTALNEPTGYTRVDRSGRFLLFTNYRDGRVGSYRLGDDGTVGAAGSLLNTPNREAHCVVTTHDNRFAYVPCVKENNALYQYAFDADTGVFTPLDPFDAQPPAGFGPRHGALHPTLPIVYFSNEQQLGVSVYAIADNGQLSDVQHATTLPRRAPFQQGTRGMHASDLVITPDGTRLFVAVRDFVGDEDSVFTFDIGADGRLSLAARTPVGDIPWKLGLSPHARHLLVAEVGTQRLSVHAIGDDGTLTPAAEAAWAAPVRDFVIHAER